MSDLLDQIPRKPISAAVTTGSIMVALRNRYCAPEFAFFEEVGDSGASSRVYADGVALNMWSSRGYAITGFEVKASRSDWLRELKRPEKSEPILSKCDFWYLVAPEGVYQLDEVPIAWGILAFKDGKLREVRKAPRLEPKAITRAFVAQMFRRGAAKEERDITARVDKAMADARAAHQKRIDDAVTYKTRELQKKADKWDAFVKLVGEHKWVEAEGVARAVKAVQKAGITGAYSGINDLLQKMRWSLRSLEEAAAFFHEEERNP